MGSMLSSAPRTAEEQRRLYNQLSGGNSFHKQGGAAQYDWKNACKICSSSTSSFNNIVCADCEDEAIKLLELKKNLKLVE